MSPSRSPRLGLRAPNRVIVLTIAAGVALAPSAAAAQEAPVSTIKVVKKKAPARDSRTTKTEQRAPSKAARAPAATPAPTAPAGPRPSAPPAYMPKAASRPTPNLVAPPAAEPSRSVMPWITLAGSVAAGVAGAVFMSRSISALNEDVQISVKNVGDGTSTVELPDEVRDQQRRVLTNGVAGTALLSIALTGAIASIIALN